MGQLPRSRTTRAQSAKNFGDERADSGAGGYLDAIAIRTPPKAARTCTRRATQVSGLAQPSARGVRLTASGEPLAPFRRGIAANRSDCPGRRLRRYLTVVWSLRDHPLVSQVAYAHSIDPVAHGAVSTLVDMDAVQAVCVIGSCARGESDGTSDIDLLALVEDRAAAAAIRARFARQHRGRHVQSSLSPRRGSQPCSSGARRLRCTSCAKPLLSTTRSRDSRPSLRVIRATRQCGMTRRACGSG